MAGSSASLSFRLFGVDVSASRTIRSVGDQAQRTSHSLGNLGLSLGRVSLSATTMAAKVVGGAFVLANMGQALVQAGGAAGLAAPALLTGAQAMFTLKLASDGVKQSMQKFAPQLDSLKKAASSGLTPGLDAGMRSLMTNLPVVRDGIHQTAQAFGDLAELGGKVFSGPAFRGDLKTIMASNTIAIRNFGMAGISMARSLVDVAVAASPAWQSVSKLGQTWAATAQAWIAGKRANGELQDAIEQGVRRVGQFGRIFINLGATVVNVFRAINTGLPQIDIASTLESYTGWLRRMTALGTPASRAISTFFTIVRTGAITAKQYIGDAANALRTGFQTGDTDYGGWIGFFEKIGDGTHQLADKVRSDLIPQLKLAGPAFVQAFSSKQVTNSGWIGIVQRMAVSFRQLVDFVRQDLLPTLLDIGKFLVSDVLPPVMDISNVVRQVLFKALSAAGQVIRGTVIPALQPLARILRDDVVPLVRAVGDWIQKYLIPAAKSLAEHALRPLRGAFDSIRSAIDQNRPQIEAIGRVLGTLAGLITRVVAPVVGAILGEAFRLAGQAISGVITVIGFLVRAFGGFVTGVSIAVSSVITFFRQLGDMALRTVEFTLHIFAKLPGPLGAPFRKAEKAVKSAHETFDREMTGAAGAVRREAKRINDAIDGIDSKKYIQVNITGGSKAISDAWRVWNEINKIPSKKSITVQEFTASYNYSAGRNALFGAPHAAGGPVSPWTTYLVGERGPEMLTMGARGGYITPNHALGGTTVVVNVAGSVKSERELADVVRDAIARAARGNGGRTGL